MASTYSGGQVISSTPSNTFSIGNNAPSVDNIRRTFGIGEKVAELAPESSIFFSYLSKLGKKTTDETVWRPLEYRNQWQRRNFKASQYKMAGGDTLGTTAITGLATPASTSGNAGTNVVIWVDYDKHGKSVKSTVEPKTTAFKGYAPIFLTLNQVLRVDGVAYKIVLEPSYYKYTGAGTGTASSKSKAGTELGYAIIALSSLEKIAEDAAGDSPTNDAIAAQTAAWNKEGQIMGSQWGEATGAPEGFRDELSSVEFYTQIFKTAVPLMSGSMQATRYRGYANEWKRLYTEHLKAHKMDLENAFLFGQGAYHSADERFSWGLVPFLEQKGGKRYQFDLDGGTAAATSDATYHVKAGFNYDGMVDVMDDFMSYESGNSGQKVCLTSREVINNLHKMGDGNFLSNSFSKADLSATNNKEVFAASLDVKSSSFMPVDITSISTSYGSMNFIAHPLFRGDMAKKAVCMDLSNISLRPLAGNGISRDTFIETNVQENDIDGRKDMIITEAGLEVMLPETHAVIDFV